MLVWVGVVLAAIILTSVITFLLSKKFQEKAAGICNFTLEQSVHKEKNKQKILELFKEKDKLTNEQIREAVGISRRSVIRYMDVLEKMGKVKQVGDAGRFVTYSLNQPQ